MVQDIIWKTDSHSACQTTACFLYGTQMFITVLTAYSIYSQLSSVFGGLLHPQREDAPCRGDKGDYHSLINYLTNFLVEKHEGSMPQVDKPPINMILSQFPPT